MHEEIVEMGVKTKEEYIESLRQMKPTAYMFGERITDIVDNPPPAVRYRVDRRNLRTGADG